MRFAYILLCGHKIDTISEVMGPRQMHDYLYDLLLEHVECPVCNTDKKIISSSARTANVVITYTWNRKVEDN